MVNKCQNCDWNEEISDQKVSKQDYKYSVTMIAKTKI